ncbi:hypothetical protein SAMN05518672_1081, partial [Chitinophaga sp. CF118]|uniref:Ig-like domain-containing protein n=1 Tax=Chitinophaga sp. CF118 TaxID=1884367 RepID=UPI0008E0BD0E
PPIINCSSVNTTGVFIMPDSSLVAPHDGEIGSWSVVSYTGIDVAAGETIDDYIKIYTPAKMGTKVSIPFGSTVVLGWTAKALSNTSCTLTSLDTLMLVNDPTNSEAGEDSTHCGNFDDFFMNALPPDATLTGPAAETGTWTLISGTATIDDIHAYNTKVTVTSVQDVKLTWSIVNAAGCGGNVDTVILHKALPPTAVLNTPITICNTAGTFNIDSLSTVNAPDTFSLRAGTSPLPGFVTVTDQPLTWPITVTYPTTPVPAPGVYNFILTVRTGNLGCTTDIPFVLNLTSGPTDPTGVTVGTPNICDTGVTTLTVVGGSLGKQADGITDNAKWMWYKDACGGTPIDSGATITVDTITTTTTYYVRAEGPCGTTACASGVVTVFQKPAKPDVGPDLAHCADPVFTMVATTPTIGTGLWTVLSGSATITDPTSPTTTVNVVADNTASLVWTVTNNVCVVKDTIILSNAANVLAAAGPDQNNCANTAFTLAGNNTGAGTGLWTIVSGSATIALPTSPTSAVTVPTGSTATLRWTITNGTCVTTDDVVLTNYATPTPSVAG